MEAKPVQGKLDKEVAVLTEIGYALTKPEALSQWRRSREEYHKQREQEDALPYDQRLFDERITTLDQQQENQMQRVFSELIEHAEKGFHAMLIMSRVTFIAGIIIVLSTFLVEIAAVIKLIEPDWKVAVFGGGILGGIGMGGILWAFIKGPHTQIQNSIGNLAQVEVAFLSFLNQLKNFDWSMATNLDEVERLSGLVSTLRRETMADMQKYLEKETIEPQDIKKASQKAEAKGNEKDQERVEGKDKEKHEANEDGDEEKDK
ncbi:MAG: hypothetical protein IH975_11220 [Nitrospinae bacterium]|nr:hypothetical protein [Nitrospinota bacterium]